MSRQLIISTVRLSLAKGTGVSHSYARLLSHRVSVDQPLKQNGVNRGSMASVTGAEGRSEHVSAPEIRGGLQEQEKRPSLGGVLNNALLHQQTGHSVRPLTSAAGAAVRVQQPPAPQAPQEQLLAPSSLVGLTDAGQSKGNVKIRQQQQKQKQRQRPQQPGAVPSAPTQQPQPSQHVAMAQKQPQPQLRQQQRRAEQQQPSQQQSSLQQRHSAGAVGGLGVPRLQGSTTTTTNNKPISVGGGWAELAGQQSKRQQQQQPQQRQQQRQRFPQPAAAGSGGVGGSRAAMDQETFKKYSNIGQTMAQQQRKTVGGGKDETGSSPASRASGFWLAEALGLKQPKQAARTQAEEEEEEARRNQMWGDVPIAERGMHHSRSRATRPEWAARRKEQQGGRQMSKKDSVRHARLRALRKVPLVLPHTPLTVRELSRKLGMKMEDVRRRLVRLGEPASITPDSLIELDTAELLGLEMRRTVTRMTPTDNLLEYKARSKENRPDWPARAPVVCVMGHVDHGKTTLLDALRKTKMAAAEAGGITQKLGAFHLDRLINGEGERGLTFLDTPGHAAFMDMRVNGANATDIVLLVVSATDGVQQQTEEVLKLIGREECTVMVAVTKVDKLGGEEEEVKKAMERIERQLAEHGIMTESLGGDVQVVPVSAVTGHGLEDLVERLALQADMMELRADRHGPGEGVVLDCSVDKGLGTVVSVLVKWGALEPGAFVVAGQQYGRVRKLLDETGKAVDAAKPSIPVRVLGFKELPSPGDEVVVVADEERAKRIVEARRAAAEREKAEAKEAVEVLDDEEREQLRELMQAALSPHGSKKTKAYLALQQAAARDAAAGKKEAGRQVVVPFVVKADGKGLLDAITSSLAAYESDVLRAEVIHAGCGAITGGDLELAMAAGSGGEEHNSMAAVVLGFGVGFANSGVQEVARREKLAVHRQSVIYSLLDDVKAVLQERMPLERVETPEGKLEVQQLFALSGRRKTKHNVAGCRVLHGSAFAGGDYRYRVLRGGEVVCDESAAHSLYHFKEVVQEVTKGMECGLSLERFGEFQPGDVVECYRVAQRRKDVRDVFPF